MYISTNNYILRILDSSYTIDLLRYNENNIVFHKFSMPKKNDNFLTFEYSEYILDEEFKSSAEGKFYRYYIFEKNGNSIIGDVSLYDIKYANVSSAFLGIKIDKDHANKGIGTEVVSAMIAFAKNELSLHSLRVTILSDNIASIKLFTKLGFQYDGIIKDLFLTEDGWKSHNLYSLIL